ncbi:MAG: FixH family protein, partial [Alphaproteobacteria bacterium]|nr:FixH family protein [Alphaproteobacteria bacterium]
ILIGTVFTALIFGLTSLPGAAHAASHDKAKMPAMHGHSDHSGHKPAQKNSGHPPSARPDKIPEDLDTARTKLSEQGKYKVNVTSRLNPVAINKMHSWILQVRKPDGTPVENAMVKIAGGMPMHGPELPTTPRVTKNLGEGKYLIEGVRFNMAGWWELKIAVGGGHHMDNVTFNLVLK